MIRSVTLLNRNRTASASGQAWLDSDRACPRATQALDRFHVQRLLVRFEGIEGWVDHGNGTGNRFWPPP
jgi:hypothetical protein